MPMQPRNRWTFARVWMIAALLLGASAAREALAVTNPVLNLNLFFQNDLRAMAMGNAFAAVARGEDALLYNPAGLVLYDFDLKAEYSVGFQGESGTFAQDTYALMGGTGVSAPQMQTYLTKYQGTTQRYNYQTFGSGVANLGYLNFGFGAGSLDSHRYAFTFGALVPGNGLTITDLNAKMQTGGVAFKLGNGKALLGIAAKSVDYTNNTAFLDYTLIGNSLNPTFTATQYAPAGLYDLGLLYRVEFWPSMRPQLGITAFNVGGTTLKGPTPSTQAFDVPASYNIGLSLGPETPVVHWLLSIEYEDVTDALRVWDGTVNQPRSATQRTHAGLEIGLIRTPTGNNMFNLRAGTNGSHLTYGWEVNLWVLRLLYATGKQDLGYNGKPDVFNFTGYQVGIALAW
jgi:hypothetical protein